MIEELQVAPKISSLEFIFLSACTMLLTALGIDIMLPAFGAVRIHFQLGSDSTEAAQIISFFFMGQIGQIIYGTLSDRFGRLPILRVGFPLYIGGGIAAAFAPDLKLMLAARFIAGMGASALLMTTVAGVRDRFVGDRMARTMSLILTIFLFVPIVAPFLGAAILSVASWRAVFLTPPIFAIFVFFWSLRLEESLSPEDRLALNWSRFVLSARQILRNGTFVRYSAITTVLFCAFSSYIGSSERIVGQIYGRPQLFKWIFGGTGVVMSLSSLLNARLASRYGARKTIRGLLIAYTIAAAILLLITLVQGSRPNVYLFFIFVALVAGINIAIEPNSSSLALEPVGEMAGLAAAIYGTSFFVFGAVAGSFINQMLARSVAPLAVSFFVIGVISLILVYSDQPKLR